MIATTPGTFRALAGRLALVVFAVAAINLLAGFALDRARDRCATRESGVIVNARAAAPDILILGSSRAKYHYDDVLLARLWGRPVFNAGDEGKGIPFSRVVLEQVALFKKPKAVILDVMFFAEDTERVHALDPWYDVSPVLRSLPSVEGVEAARDWKTPLLMKLATYRYAGAVTNTVKGAFKAKSASGFVALESSAGGSGIAGAAPDAALFLPQLDLLVKECRAAGIEIVLCVSAPVSKSFGDAVASPVAAYARGAGVPFVRFDAATFPALADPALIRDAGHLNRAGAEAFTRTVAVALPPLLPATFGSSAR